MAHRDERFRLAPEQLLEPEDAVDVEVVGGLVEEEQLRLAREGAGDGEPLPPSAGEQRHRLLVVVESALAHRDRDASLALVRIRSRLPRRFMERGADRRPLREHRVLRHVADAQPLADRPRAVGRRLEPGQDLQ